MGIFSKILNYVTGGSAKVGIQLDGPRLSGPFRVQISAEVLNDDLNCERVYLLVRCIEKKLDAYKPENEADMTDNEKILQQMAEWDENEIYHSEIEIAPASMIKKGEKCQWVKEINLEGKGKPSLKSPNHQVIWQFQAGLDIPGNDPDSGWMEFELSSHT